ncbi:ABC transporter ATP-binding protein [Maritimibacter sp. 55A14]|uniref:ABC transporter ATP-binding protein n=1 Tax=Maritimibacter sp. 55A14 TaxID=2174844 RepID=UPI000D603BC3|nr:ABC transporter ATP-binding protein [Maritimibacter sp. 55A14]PWE32548.1 ABC transporter ATP-binding protein [Maritimibacter sp. 55A14]
MIRVDIRARSFGSTPVLGAIRLTLGAGERVAVLGPSGAGKTTLLRIVAGIDTEFDGSVTQPERTAMVFQDPTLLPWRSVLENVALPNAGLPRAAAQAMLARVGLEGKAALFPGQLSLGQQRRTALARAFAGTPDFLIMDEPFVSLDPAKAEEIIALTEAMLDEHRPALLFVTHSRAEARRLAHRVLTLDGVPAVLSG